MTARLDRPARILHLLPDLQIGGGQMIVLNGVRYADRERFDVRVASVLDDRELWDAFAEAGARPVSLAHVKGQRLRTFARTVSLLRDLAPDILHVHSGSDRRFGQPAAALTGTTVVGNLHGHTYHLGDRGPVGGDGAVRRLRGRIEGPLLDRIERRVVRHYVSDSLDLKEAFTPLVHAPITVLTMAIPSDRFTGAAERAAATGLREQLGLDPAAPVLVSVARLHPGKGQDHLVRMMATLRDQVPDATLLLVGDGELRPEIERQVAAAGLEGRVRLLGNRTDIPELLALADVFVFGSESEGFGIALLEAMAAGKPIVAFRLPAFAEFAEDGVNGVFVDLGDDEALARATAELLAHPERARTMGESGRRMVAERFPPDAVARTFEGVYDEVLGRARASQAVPVAGAGA